MAFLPSSGGFPPVQPFTSSSVTADERINAIDFVNRSNFLFAEYNHDKIVSTFLPQAVVYHFHGTVRGHDAIRQFLEKDYPYLIPGVSRHATNHIVDRDTETGGVTVRYYEQLFRNSWPAAEDDGAAGKNVHGDARTSAELPALWFHSVLIDRLILTEDGWKIHERYVDEAVFNDKFTPGQQ
ncbi:hypothetical protein NQ176_g4611 [Zarea fungicola]|uniref:Uncharacterized protein n=1 Tax=Zarea fungicola TaxID=93591 RepID=A0ACC1NDB4_9HYPO|nr:hypothetical protein NQ176_g4611 [Lecanicillium fungicola]